MSEEFFQEAEAAIAAVMAAGEEPAAMMLTSALYEHLNLEADGWRIHAERAYLGREEPWPLYGCTVTIKPGADHGWDLRTASGRIWDPGGPVVYSVGR